MAEISEGGTCETLGSHREPSESQMSPHRQAQAKGQQDGQVVEGARPSHPASSGTLHQGRPALAASPARSVHCLQVIWAPGWSPLPSSCVLGAC